MRTRLAALVLSLAVSAFAAPAPPPPDTEGRTGGASCDDGPVREEVVRELVQVINGVEGRLCRQKEQRLAEHFVCERLDRASRPAAAAPAQARDGGGDSGEGECPRVSVESRGVYSGREGASAPAGPREGRHAQPPLLRREELEGHPRAFSISSAQGRPAEVKPDWLGGRAAAVTEGEFRAAFRRAVESRSERGQPAQDGGSCVSCGPRGQAPSRRPGPGPKEGPEPVGGSSVGPGNNPP